MITAQAMWHEQVRRFISGCDKPKSFLTLDLDGTALLEDRGKVFISSSVEKAVRAMHDLKIPTVINTLRFPLSVMRTVGEAWYQIADVPIPTVLLNGSVLGYIKRDESGLHYEELAAHPLMKEELAAMLTGIKQLHDDGIDDILLFFYSNDWREGETLWTPKQEKVAELQKKYVSASRVIACPTPKLEEELYSRNICMVSAFVDRPEDTLMAYQHSKRSSFFTTKGVNKATGLLEMAEVLNLSAKDSIGAGDTEMDTFLSEVGLAVVVGSAKLPFRGRHDTVRVHDPLELGELLLGYADLIGEMCP